MASQRSCSPFAAPRRRGATALPLLLMIVLAQLGTARGAADAASATAQPVSPSASPGYAAPDGAPDAALRPPPWPPSGHSGADPRRARGAAAVLDGAADALAHVAGSPPALPSSGYASFGQAATLFPRALGPLQPTVDALAAPPGPPIFSTVDPNAFIYVGPRDAAHRGARAAAPERYADAITVVEQDGVRAAGGDAPA
jgi:hypothetical protein